MTRSVSTNYTAVGNAFPKADAGNDPFLKEDVQVLAEAVDDHDHASTRGLAVQRLGTGVVVEANLANDAATFDKVADHASTDALRAIGANHIRNNAVVTRTILDGAVTATKLGVGAAAGLTFPRVYARYTVNSQTLTTAAETAVAFTEADLYDTFDAHSPTVNPTRLTVTVAGLYMLFGYAQFAPNATSTRELYFRLTRSAIEYTPQLADARVGVATDEIMISLAAPFEFQADDFIELIVFQRSGGDLVLQDAGFGLTGFGG